MDFRIGEGNTFVKELLPLSVNEALADKIIDIDDKANTNIYHYTKDFNCSSSEELKTKIEKVKDSNANSVDAVVIYPTNDLEELDSVYFRYMALPDDERLKCDHNTEELFGMTNRELYAFVKSNMIKDKSTKDEVETYTPTEESSIFTNDLPLFTPKELLEKITEDYSCFNESETESIKRWREEYALMGIGIKTENYNKYNLERINILRKAIYENNNDAIIQCGWVPGIEFNSENRVKASEIVREKMEVSVKDLIIGGSKFQDWVYNSDETIEDVFNRDSIEETKDYSKLDKSFKKKSGIDYELIDISSSKAKKYIDNDAYLSYNYPYDFLKKTKKSGEIMVEKNTNKVIGYVFVSSDTVSRIEIYNDYRGYGLSEILLRDAIEKYKAIKIGVFHDNEVAINLYKKFGFAVVETRKDKNGQKFYIMELNNTKDKKAVSLVFVAGTSIVAKTIRRVQGTQFSHASISLDDDLSRIYSYNKRDGFNGFTYESVKGYIEDGVQKMGVYTFLVSDAVYDKLEKTLDKFSMYINDTKYSILNLLTIPINIPLDMNMKMVCSEFVDKLLKTAELDLTNKKSSLVSPRDLITTSTTKSNIVEVFNGNPKDFKPSVMKKKIQKLKKSNLPVYEFVEYSEGFINEAKSFPVQFDNDGNLILKNIRKINFEQEYANSHRLLKEYEKTKAYEPMKFELAKMQFFITLLEKKIYKQGKDKSADELKVRARFLNDFKKYLHIVTDNEPDFNFFAYYEQSPFNDALIKIDKSTMEYGYRALKYLIK